MYITLEHTIIIGFLIFIVMSLYRIKHEQEMCKSLFEFISELYKIQREYNRDLISTINRCQLKLGNIDATFDAFTEDLTNIELDIKDYLVNKGITKNNEIEDDDIERELEREYPDEPFDEIPAEADEVENETEDTDIDFEVDKIKLEEDEDNNGYSKAEDFERNDDTDDIEEVKAESIDTEPKVIEDSKTEESMNSEEEPYDEIADIISLIQQAKSVEELLDLKQFYSSRGNKYQPVVDFIENKLELDF